MEHLNGKSDVGPPTFEEAVVSLRSFDREGTDTANVWAPRPVSRHIWSIQVGSSRSFHALPVLDRPIAATRASRRYRSI